MMMMNAVRSCSIGTSTQKVRNWSSETIIANIASNIISDNNDNDDYDDDVIL